MKICTCCSAQNLDDAVYCKVCKGQAFYFKLPPGASTKAAPPRAATHIDLSSRLLSIWLSVICFSALGAEIWQGHAYLTRQAADFAAKQARATAAHAAAVARQTRLTQLRLNREETEHQLLLLDPSWLSGSMARDQHEAEWSLRIAHNPKLAQTPLETNLLTMERFGQDATLAAQTALEKVARLASPPDSRVEVDADGGGYRVRVAFMMSRLSRNEAGAITKYHTTDALRSEIQELSAGVLRDLYEYCGSRDILSISVTCNHTVRQTAIPDGATEDERTALLEQATPVQARLYRVSLDESHARAVADWRQVSLSRVMDAAAVEFDGLNNLTILNDSASTRDPRDAGGELQF